MARVRSNRNASTVRKSGAARISGVRRDAGSKPCPECGSKPGFPCYRLTSVRQVAEGREGAYLKPQQKYHGGR